jgi:hypothetical protein
MKNHIPRLCLKAVQNSDRQAAPSFAKKTLGFAPSGNADGFAQIGRIKLIHMQLHAQFRK